PTSSLHLTGYAPRSSSTSRRHTVGGAHSVVTSQREITSRVFLASNRAQLCTKMVAPAFHGAKKLLQACLAHPGVLMFKWMSSGRMPIQYMVARWPTG